MVALNIETPLPTHQRYLHKPFIGSSHSWALGCIKQLPTAARVLDIGCGSGGMGSALLEMGFSNLEAVEPDPAARSNASAIYSRVVPSLDTLHGETYNLILLLDVLEHTTNPEEFLAQIVAHLAPGGSVLISVPNIAHWSTRLSLLFGRFQYTSRGILDRTHYSHFDRARFKTMLGSQKGLELVDLAASIPPAELALPRWLWDNTIFRRCSELRLLSTRFIPGWSGYQHLGWLRRVDA